ncbi:acylphosphatase-2 [Drosophila grimshawi]|uniref:Acylphosphatase n=1 Tax=Drosophila grimshawi TaxID=7222 RepID=B4JVI0_DROGR|nr:acylphosphatase-2 [Drosophila grimshawi]EDV98448.1 GH22670 [Drosophila grimshawi]
MASLLSAKNQLFTCGFEVFGEVQGVQMRKATRSLALSNGVRGWVMNTDRGTVQGELEGTLPSVNELKFWLLCFGSENAIVDRAEFTPTLEIPVHSFDGFTIRYHPDQRGRH